MPVRFVNNSPEILAELEIKKRAALEAVGATCASHARNTYTAEGRVDTDFMRGSTTHLVQGDTVDIGTSASYAIYHEMGTGVYIAGGRKTPWAYPSKDGWRWTRGVPPTHAIRNCVANHTQQIKQIMNRIFRGG